MSTILLIKSIGRIYYRQNAGLLAFLAFIMVLAVGRANEVGLLEYHYSLILGILTSPSFLLVVMGGWLLYAWKCWLFVRGILQRREYSFLYQLSLSDTSTVYRQLLFTQLLLFLPVWTYALIMTGVGYYRQLYLPTTLVLIFVISVCLLSAVRYLYLLRHPDDASWHTGWKIPSLAWRKLYLNFLIRYVQVERPLLFWVIKLYSCGVLYGMISRDFNGEYDHHMVLLFYSFGLLGHGVLIHRIKEMEETRLGFYRGLPLSLGGRFLQYAAFYFLFLLPEFIIIGSLTPAHLTYFDAVLYLFLGFSVLLFLNSVLLFPFPRIINYLKILGCIFFLIFWAVLMGILTWLCVALFILSIGLFFTRYYQPFEP